MTTDELKKIIIDNKQYLADNNFMGFYYDVLYDLQDYDANKIIEFLDDCGIFDDGALGDTIPRVFSYIPKSWKSVDNYRFIPQTHATLPPQIKILDKSCLIYLQGVDVIDAKDVEEIRERVLAESSVKILYVSGKLKKINRHAFEDSDVLTVKVDYDWGGKLDDNTLIALSIACGNNSIEIESM